MKKFSFKKLTTISLFFTSIIFTSAFTTCFIPIVSTSHSNEQPNATKIDLNDYNNKTLPKPFEKPDSPINQEQLITQLKEAEGNQSLPWVNWKCYPNQFKDFVPTLSDTGGSFVLSAKPNAVNYVGSSTAKISFYFTREEDLSELIPNDSVLPIIVDYDLWTDTSLANRYLLRVLKQQYGLDINEITITPDYSSSTYNNPFAMLTIQSKPNSLVYSGSTTIKFQFYPYPKYATSGCVAIYNANYNTGFGSHTNGDTQWFNSVDGTDTINKLNTTFDDNYAKLPIDDGSTGNFGFVTPYLFNQIQTNSSATFEVVFAQTVHTTGETVIMADYESGGMGVNLRVVPPYDFYFQYYYGGYTMLYTNIETSLNTIYSISVTNDVTNNRLFIYMNGNKVMDIESVNIISGPTQNTRLAIGNNPNGSSVGNAGLRGKYYCLRVYNQSLTEQQVLNNWQIDQNLYNI